MKYYSLKKILQEKADVNIIVGQRGNGKSYSLAELVLKDYKENKKRFIYIRRWLDDIKQASPELFAPLQDLIEEIFGEGFTITYYRRKFYLVNANGTKIDIIGFAVALSETHHTKSVNFPDVHYIWIDEIIQMQGERVLPGEQSKYENTLSTIIRENKNDCKIFIAGNTVSKFSWIFVYYGIQVNTVKQGDIIVKDIPTDDNKQFLRVAFEYCEYNEEVGKKVSKFARSNMIKGGQWEIAPVSDIPTVSGELHNDRKLFTMWDSDGEILIGCYLRNVRWSTLEKNPNTYLIQEKIHRRNFLIIKQADTQSRYYHLTNEKTLSYHQYNDLDYMLNDIKEETGIDFIHELFSGRIFANDMFIADYFNHCWGVYGKVPIRNLL